MSSICERPNRLKEVDLSSVWPGLPVRGLCYMTMAVGQWDGTLEAAYDAGFVLLELDDTEKIIRAFRNVLAL